MAAYDQTTDGHLIRAAAQGDSGAFTRLYDRHIQASYRYALSLCGDPHCAQDLSQEAFIRAYGELAKFRAPWNIRSWLFRVIRNHYLNENRQASRVQGLPPESALPAAEASPEHRAVQSEQSARVLKAIRMLSPNYREALMLREVGGLSYNEIAYMMGISLDQVKVLLHRARARFKEEYGLRLLAEDVTAPCGVLREMLDLWHDGESPAALDTEVRTHLRSCQDCRHRRRELLAITELLAVLPVGRLPAWSPDIVKAEAAQQPLPSKANKIMLPLGVLVITLIVVMFYYGVGFDPHGKTVLNLFWGQGTIGITSPLLPEEDSVLPPSGDPPTPAGIVPVIPDPCVCGDAVCNVACEDSVVCPGDCGGDGETIEGPGSTNCSCTMVCTRTTRSGACIERGYRDCGGNVCSP